VRRPARRGEAGFTLIELLITVVIMGIIFVPLSDFFIQYLDTSTQTQQRLSDSHDLQIVAAYFSQDVANTGLRNQTAGQTTFAAQQSVWTSGFATFCGAPIAAGTTPILELAWDDASAVSNSGVVSGADTIDSVLYYVTSSNGQGSFQRESCSGSTVGPVATVVHNLQKNSTPSVNCLSPAGVTTTCDTAPPPVVITLTLNVQGGTSDAAGAKNVMLTGQRRQGSS
jgi:prepilin-type N-terminal cleavage/methylation domain-containing protein